jgi:hypothetical protein
MIGVCGAAVPDPNSGAVVAGPVAGTLCRIRPEIDAPPVRGRPVAEAEAVRRVEVTRAAPDDAGAPAVDAEPVPAAAVDWKLAIVPATTAAELAAALAAATKECACRVRWCAGTRTG